MSQEKYNATALKRKRKKDLKDKKKYDKESSNK
jgi:hypothetical protein